ncbi:MAG: c-type cytochrome [Thiohalobacteraceae bacterium]
MKPVKLVLLCSVLALAGCGDSNEVDSARTDDDRVLGQPADIADDAAGTGQDAMGEPDGMATDGVPGDTSVPDTVDDPAPVTGDDTNATDTAPATGDTMTDGSGTSDSGMGGDESSTAAATEADPAMTAQAEAPAAGAAAAVDTAGADLAMGQTVYQGKCQACHATGAAGAPKLDDQANWEPRIAKGMDVLVKNAIEGFKGDVGFMPPKGGFASLTDEEVAASVAYMVSEVQK